jgi:hypothetical protein
MKIYFTRHKKSLPWIRSTADGYIYQGIFQVHKVHTPDKNIRLWHITVGPFAWAAAWRVKPNKQE